MKKLLSIILVGILAVSSFILTTFATENEKSETEIEREKLGWLLDAFKILNTNIGEARIYNCVAGDTYNDAYNLYNQDELATAEEYKNMKDKLYSAAYNLHVDVAYAKTAYDNACKEQNYNNWYSDEQWNEFQYKLADLKTDLEPYIAGTNDYDVWAITNAYNELLAVYNKMTNAYTLKGDVNKDGVVNVVDATLIQKYIAHEVEFTGAQKMLTNVAKYESDISVIAATDLQKFIVGLNGDFGNNHIFLDEQDGIQCFDDTMRWYAYGNYNISPRYPYITYGPYVKNEHTDFFVVGYYDMMCKEHGYTK